jgi:hypothetical protein
MASTQASTAGVIQPQQNDALSKVELVIHNHFSNIELIFSIYTGDIKACYLSPNQNVNAPSTTRAGFEIDPNQEESTGVLMYRLQRKNTEQTDEATYLQLFIIWKVTSSKVFSVVLDLIEHDKSHVWNRDSLLKLAERYELANVQFNIIKANWLMYDNTMLLTWMNITRKKCYKLDLFLVKTSTILDARRLQYIHLDR